jgi:hypothetical protein
VRFDVLKLDDEVRTGKGTWRHIREIHIHEDWGGKVYNWPGGGKVTEEELLMCDGKWR